MCRVVRGLRRLRIGAIGARPAAFNTVRYSEKILEANGISVEPIDLSEILGRIARMGDRGSRGAWPNWTPSARTSPPTACRAEALLKMAKLGAVIDQWMAQTEVAISAVQCWTSLEEYFGVVPCTVMSMMSENLMSSACEVDICGVIGMHALQLASETPSALLDWNNNYGDDPDKAVCFHCSNLPKHFFREVQHGFPADHRRHGGPREHLRHLRGPGEARADELRALLHQRPRGQDRTATWAKAHSPTIRSIPSAARAWCGFRNLQGLLRYICERGFEHHVAANLAPGRRRPCAKPPRGTWVGACYYSTSTDRARGHRGIVADGAHEHRCRSRFRNPERSRFHLRQREGPAGRGRRPSIRCCARRKTRTTPRRATPTT